MSIFLERQKVRKRRAWDKWIRLAERILFSVTVVLGGLAIVYGLYLLISFGPFFQISNVTVEGKLAHLSTEKVIDISQIKLGQNMFGVDVETLHKRLKENPWVNQTAVRRYLPHTLWIYVEEYVPVAIIQKEGRLYYVDHEGVIFKPLEPMDPKVFPVITGIDESGLKNALSLLSVYLDSSFGQMWGVSELHIGDEGQISIVTENGPLEVMTIQDALASKLDLLGRWQGVMSRRGGRITYIIANDEKKITVGYN